MQRLLFLSALILSAVFSVSAHAVDFSAVLAPNYKHGEVIVRFKDPDKGAKSLAAVKASSVRAYKRIQAQHIRLAGDASVADALEELRKDPNVLYAEPNYLVRKLAVPNDPRFIDQWNLTRISAPAAWDTYTGPVSSVHSIIVALLDTGVAYNHPDLVANLWTNPGEIPNNGVDDDGNGIVDDYYGANFGGTRLPGDPWDDDTADSHGTHLSGIIGAAGNNNLGIAGINWTVRVMAVKFLHGPSGTGDLSDALRGVEYALAKGAKIINMSFEVSSDSRFLRDAVEAADRAGVLVVSAAGNSGKDLDVSSVYPASIRTANNIAVSASTVTDTLASYSDYGRFTVDLAAPGGTKGGTAVLSTVWLNNGTTLYRTTAGTSMAAPHVAGAAALLWNQYPSLTAYQVKARILNSVDLLDAFSNRTITGGRLNLSKVLSSATANLPAIFSTSARSVAQGGTITINGVNFGNVRGSVDLVESAAASKSATRQLEIVSWNDTTIVAAMPANAASGVIKVNGQGSGFPVTVTDTPVPDPAPVSGGGGGGGGCFIATAAWGSYLHPKVEVLRDFRDSYLLTNGPGRLFVDAYYAVSPPLADFIAQHENLRTLTRWALTPVVMGAEYPLFALLALVVVMFGLGGLLVPLVQQRHRG